MTPIRELIKLDDSVLAVLSTRGGVPTYVIRNCLDWPGEYFHRRGLKTAQVLRACRRLAKRRLVEEVPGSWAVMKTWQITDAGRRALSTSEKEPSHD